MAEHTSNADRPLCFSTLNPLLLLIHQPAEMKIAPRQAGAYLGLFRGLSRYFIMLIVWPERGLVILKCFYPDQNTTVAIKERERERVSESQRFHGQR